MGGGGGGGQGAWCGGGRRWLTVGLERTSYALAYFWKSDLARGSGFLSGCHSLASLRYARLIGRPPASCQREGVW